MPDSGPQLGYYASRPTLRIDGQVVDSLGNDLMQSLLVEETTLGLFRCEARLLNWGTKNKEVDYLLFDGKVVDFGKTLAGEMGAPGAQSSIFAGRITGMEGLYPPQRPPEVVLLAEDRFQDLRMERRTRSFE